VSSDEEKSFHHQLCIKNSEALWRRSIFLASNFQFRAEEWVKRSKVLAMPEKSWINSCFAASL
jgi:hypothetical protein